MPNAVTGVGWGTERLNKQGLFQHVFGIFLVVSGPPGRARNGAQRIVAPGATLERRSTFQIQPMAARLVAKFRFGETQCFCNLL